MKHFFSSARLALTIVATLTLAACNKDNDEPTPTDPDAGKEYRFVRLLVADEQASTLTQLTPFDGSAASFSAKYPLATLYPTASGRYAAVLYQSQNLVEMFDTGLESHDGHADVKGTAKWAAATATGPKPTHFKSHDEESLIFNDGDGTLSVGDEDDFHTPGARFRTINAGLAAHHGAMAHLSNDTYAVTETQPGSTAPTGVRIINQTGGLVHAATLQTGSLHGNASDGENAVFGAWTTTANTTGSVLVVNKSGQQRLIANPASLGANRLGTIYYAKGAKKFIGYSATKGAYLIDLSANTMTPIYDGTDAIQCKLDYAGQQLLVLTLGGQLRVYDLATNSLKRQSSVIAATPAADAYKPVLEASGRFAYLAVPALGEVHQVRLDDLSTTAKYKVTARPVRLALLGIETSESH
jgi:hypothetical protein